MYNDYIMDMIETFVRGMARKIFQVEDEGDDIGIYEYMSDDGNVLSGIIRSLVHQNKINQAENLLFEQLEENPSKENLFIALGFYAMIGKKTEEELLEADFSKEEIEDGISDIKRLYNVEDEPD